MSTAAADSFSVDSASAKHDKFNELFSVLEDLLKRIADTDDPDIRRKRAQVRAEMIAVQNNPMTLAPPPQQIPEADKTEESSEPEDWGQHALVALAGAAVALSVFRHSS
jgi:hypothetical protein